MHDVPVFDRFAPLYDRVMPPPNTASLTDAFDRATRDVDRVLDLAGGAGRVANGLDEETVVLDAATGMLARARSHGLPVLCADARTLPMRANAVDAIVVVDALHHLPEHDRVLRECARVLRPGGVLAVRDFDPTTVLGRLLVAAEHVIGFDSTFVAPDDLSRRLRAAGFDPATTDTGFAYTVVGRVPDGEP